MISDISAFFASFGVVTLAEMADKTQLVVMGFAARYKIKKVLLGVFLATVLINILAVAAGFLLKEILTSYSLYIRLAASLSFIGFALWTLKGGKANELQKNTAFFGPVLTIAVTFFLAEMGDKTQLAAVSLAASLGSSVAVLLGAILGMLLADCAGLFFGAFLNSKVPEHVLKWISASIFAVCGLLGYIESVRHMLNLSLLAFTTVLILVIMIIIASFILNPKEGS